MMLCWPGLLTIPRRPSGLSPAVSPRPIRGSRFISPVCSDTVKITIRREPTFFCAILFHSVIWLPNMPGRRGFLRRFFHGLIRTESAWDAEAVSRSGATGLSQFMPATWAEWVRRMDFPEDTDPTDAEANAALGAALSGTGFWNGSGPGGGWIPWHPTTPVVVGSRSWRRERPGLGDDLFGESIPVEEPRTYVRKVLSAATLYGYLYSGRTPAELHRSWGLEMIEVD